MTGITITPIDFVGLRLNQQAAEQQQPIESTRFAMSHTHAAS
jgi:hypothetical protein